MSAEAFPRGNSIDAAMIVSIDDEPAWNAWFAEGLAALAACAPEDRHQAECAFWRQCCRNADLWMVERYEAFLAGSSLTRAERFSICGAEKGSCDSFEERMNWGDWWRGAVWTMVATLPPAVRLADLAEYWDEYDGWEQILPEDAAFQAAVAARRAKLAEYYGPGADDRSVPDNDDEYRGTPDGDDRSVPDEYPDSAADAGALAGLGLGPA